MLRAALPQPSGRLALQAEVLELSPVAVAEHHVLTRGTRHVPAWSLVAVGVIAGATGRPDHQLLLMVTTRLLKIQGRAHLHRIAQRNVPSIARRAHGTMARIEVGQVAVAVPPPGEAAFMIAG